MKTKKKSRKQADNKSRVFKMPFPAAKEPAMAEQIQFLVSSEKFQTLYNHHQLTKRLSAKLASEMIELVNKEISI